MTLFETSLLQKLSDKMCIYLFVSSALFCFFFSLAIACREITRFLSLFFRHRLDQLYKVTNIYRLFTGHISTDVRQWIYYQMRYCVINIQNTSILHTIHLSLGLFTSDSIAISFGTAWMVGYTQIPIESFFNHG